MIELLSTNTLPTLDEILEVENEYSKELEILRKETLKPSDDVINYSLKQIIASSKTQTPISEC